jgi:hypothetical protein
MVPCCVESQVQEDISVGGKLVLCVVDLGLC